MNTSSSCSRTVAMLFSTVELKVCILSKAFCHVYMCRQTSEVTREWESFRCTVTVFNPANKFAAQRIQMNRVQQTNEANIVRMNTRGRARNLKCRRHVYAAQWLCTVPHTPPFASCAFAICGLSEDSECQQVAVQHRQRQRSLASSWCQRTIPNQRKR